MQIACVGDTHLCPAHGKNVVIEGGSSVVNGRAVARVGDKCACGCTIVDGSAIALCDGRPVARLGSKTSSGGVITSCAGSATVLS